MYLFRWIFHTWSDKHSIRILHALIPDLTPGARTVINDTVLPEEPGTLSSWQATRLRRGFPHVDAAVSGLDGSITSRITH